MKENTYIKKALLAFAPVFLLCYMLLIFGPAEIFFSNKSQFEFVFGEFFWIMTGIGVGVSVVLSLLLGLLPEKIHEVVVSAFLGIDVAGYVQVMFLNKNLDLLGLTPEGYRPSASSIIINILIWCAVIALIVVLCLKEQKYRSKIIFGASAFLAAIQIVALVSLVIPAEPDAFERKADDYHLSGTGQMTVSAKDNVIVFVLDYVANKYVDPLLEEYPEALDCLNDFTYYDNNECVYYGTFPSLAHMLTGNEVDPSISINDWTKSLWESPTTLSFYEKAHNAGYEVNFYTPESIYVVGGNELTLMEGKIDNLSNSAMDLTVDSALLVKTLTKMSAYRFLPNVAKNAFNTNNSEFTQIVKSVEQPRCHENYDFYDRLCSEHLAVDNQTSILSIQHLVGAHEICTSADCKKDENATRNQTLRGCMLLLETYFNELKDLGLYDDSTIIVTSDHGSDKEPQAILFVKNPGETHDKYIVNHAPVSHCEFLPTLAKAMGFDHAEFGSSYDEVSEDAQRDRLCFVRQYDENYPAVKSAWEDKEGVQNVYYTYTYNGDETDLEATINDGPDAILPMFDSFW